MKYIVTGDEMKEYDNNTIAHQGIPALELMENAAQALVERIKNLNMVSAKILIVCGIGNNGGDGLALARLLSQADMEVKVCIVGDCAKGTESFKVQKKRLDGLPVCFITIENLLQSDEKEFDIVVDAIFGVGLSRDIKGEYAAIIEKCNALTAYKLAVDIPSGICANTGKVFGCAFYADCTVTFAFHKLGLCLYPGAEYAGEIHIAPIGITEKSFEDNPPHIFTYDEGPMEYLPKRKKDGNKGTFGKVLVIAGFDTMAGAAVLCSRVVLQMGAGMVKVICAPENRNIIQGTVPEAMYGTINSLLESLTWADAVIIGPGLGKSKEVKALLEELLKTSKLPLVLDADALNLISEDAGLKGLLKHYGETKILTPHVGELARLSGLSVKDVKDNMLNVAKNMAKEYHSIVVAKDARTFVTTYKAPAYINLTGNNGMATAGSGDVLAGMIGALLVQGADDFEAACTGVYLHGMAGDKARDIYTEYGVTASRLIENIRLLEQSKK